MVLAVPKRTSSSSRWPAGKRFAFTIFDDTDLATVDNVREVYALLSDLGFRTTKSVWPISVDGVPMVGGATCEDSLYLAWIRELQRQGFEIGYHLASHHTSTRAQTERALSRFRELFGHDPVAMANHVGCDEGIYWGDARLEGASRVLYNILTRNRRNERFRGHVAGDALFWGDLCLERIRYVRNFVFRDINTLKSCPQMPYHDDRKPYVNMWFASSEGGDRTSFVKCIAEAAQDRLEEEGGACIMYTHLAKGFFEHGRLDSRFRTLMERLASKGGWFVPTSALLDHLYLHNGGHRLSPAERALLEGRWLFEKIFFIGSS